MQAPSTPSTPSPFPAPLSPLYVAPFEGEFPCDVTVLFDARGHIYFADERPEDRGVDGVLWERWGGSPTGSLEWAQHHPVRQCEVMDGRPLCGVCKGEPDRDERGMLWLLHADDDTQKLLTFPSDITTATPAVCLTCAWRALRACRVLQRGFIAVRVREAEVIGVRGTLYSPTEPPLLDQFVRFGDAALHQVVARQLMRELRNVELDETTLSGANFSTPGPAGLAMPTPSPVWG